MAQHSQYEEERALGRARPMEELCCCCPCFAPPPLLVLVTVALAAVNEAILVVAVVMGSTVGWFNNPLFATEQTVASQPDGKRWGTIRSLCRRPHALFVSVVCCALLMGKVETRQTARHREHWPATKDRRQTDRGADGLEVGLTPKVAAQTVERGAKETWGLGPLYHCHHHHRPHSPTVPPTH